MPPRKKATPEPDEAQSAPTQENILAAAQVMRMEYHEERGNENPKPWEDLSEAKQQKWLDKAVGLGD